MHVRGLRDMAQLGLGLGLVLMNVQVRDLRDKVDVCVNLSFASISECANGSNWIRQYKHSRDKVDVFHG